MMKFQRINIVTLIATLLILGGYAGFTLSTPTPPPLAEELILYNWEGDISQSVLDAFTQEYGVKITYSVYESQDEAIANIQAGNVYDVVTMEGRDIPLLAMIDRSYVPNFKNISANFRNLIYDPGNRNSIILQEAGQ
jgi:spermidine/putrescine transport system substrate-binding protein